MQTFDPNNGQIYTETAYNVPSMTPKWKRHINGRPTNPRTYRNPVRGASPLRDMALRSCCWNVLLIMPEALEEVGWWYAGMVYRQLKETYVFLLTVFATQDISIETERRLTSTATL